MPWFYYDGNNRDGTADVFGCRNLICSQNVIDLLLTV